jgi:NTP pyrophosphatase (non-canonical NTP hydrolase)
MEINQIQKDVDNWIQTIGIRYFSELTNMAILMEEVGELARIGARLYGEQSFKLEEDKMSAHKKWKEELADVLFVVVCLANQTGVNMEEAFKETMVKKTRRDFDRHQNNKKLSSE